MKAPRTVRQSVPDAAIVLIMVLFGLGLACIAGFVVSVLWQWLWP